ncbi:ubiquitin-conjugating enzyme/RWD-like protein [Polychytrium aggregatum]|uniref:ubiquitin-conjugating enzyme/RWD-like protein n=1 Tax=Polychytrium aggregatum TaxID=110093 RepID=UPI0022FDDE61|nr:ubiquitin-conjugating enzyme/RWD-like protein [Polychytrium aggregatum]KAI9203343.1 ubiquitin-conjugating enzyme/RWD-like protein [Polychytrium aggregatum]
MLPCRDLESGMSQRAPGHARSSGGCVLCRTSRRDGCCSRRDRGIRAGLGSRLSLSFFPRSDSCLIPDRPALPICPADDLDPTGPVKRLPHQHPSVPSSLPFRTAMTDHQEEQTNELEALRSIFYEEFEEIDEGPPAHFRLLVAPDDSALPLVVEGSARDTRFYLDITYTETYPDELPLLSIEDPTELSEDECAMLLGKVTEVAEQYRGMAMVFTMHSTAKEALEVYVVERAERIQREIEERIRREEEEEAARYEGKKVTPQVFEQWNAKFLKEMAELAAKEAQEKGINNQKKSARTGRQLFEKDKNLAKSDLAVLQEGDITADITEELLQKEMEGLDVEEDEEENSVLAGFREDDD